MAINQSERAFRAWPVLVQIAQRRETITYGELGDKLGIHHRAVRYVLGVIQDYCLEEKLPPLTILIVNGAGRPGSGFIAYDLCHFEKGLSVVWDFNWQSQKNPFEFSTSGDSFDSLVIVLAKEPESSEEIYRRVPSRGIKQLLFRSALLKAYKHKCAFTELSFTEALEACHIVPWSLASNAERLDVRNGMLLNSLHHRLFHRGMITISTQHRIIFFDPKQEEGTYSKFDSMLTSKLHGQKMHLPFKRNQRPLEEYILRHHQIAGWEL
ncbi:HNH endonuclease [Hahella sp. CR1]|uniref:HNH endonuclease n=1 Tax=Hahella sp. CR1 TaxID=2992807 RepID=UPI0024420C7E|nr:HNH endonuclease [Hahella sp. CR1]MDG9669316.1 HNH endonuclease [Hahella sp. CR1]